MSTERDPSLFPASSTSAKALDGSITADVQRSMATAMIRHNPALMPDDLLKSTFAGRDPVLADLVERVRQNSGKDSVQHYLLIGPRGSGKTTLLRLLAIRVNQDSGLAEEWYPVVFAEEEFSIGDVKDFFLTVLERMGVAAPSTEQARTHAVALATTDAGGAIDVVLEAVESAAASLGRRLLLLVDNVDQILEQATAGDELATRRLREILQHDPLFMVVGTSVSVFDELIDHRRPLYQFFAPIHLRPLDQKSVMEMLRRRALAEGRSLFIHPSRELTRKVRVITAITGGNPRLVVALYDVLTGTPVLQEMDALTRLVDELTPYYKSRLEALPAQQRKVLDLLIRAGGSATPTQIAERAGLRANLVAVQLARLRDASWVRVSRGADRRARSYIVADQLLRYWYQMRYLADRRHRLGFLVSFYRDLFSAAELRAIQGQLLGELERETLLAHSSRQTETAKVTAPSFGDISSRLLAIQAALPSTDDLATARWKHARLLLGAGRTNEARSVLELSREEHVLSADSSGRAGDEFYLGVADRSEGDPEATLVHLGQAEIIYRRLASERPQVHEPNLAETLNNLGNALSDLGRLEEAERAFREAEVIYRRLASERPQVHEPNLAMTLTGLARVAMGFGQPGKLGQLLKEVVRIVSPNRSARGNQSRVALAVLLAEAMPTLSAGGADISVDEQTERFVQTIEPLDGEIRRPLSLLYLRTILRLGLPTPAFDSVLARVAERVPELGEGGLIFRLAHRLLSSGDRDKPSGIDEDTWRAVESVVGSVDPGDEPFAHREGGAAGDTT